MFISIPIQDAPNDRKIEHHIYIIFHFKASNQQCDFYHEKQLNTRDRKIGHETERQKKGE